METELFTVAFHKGLNKIKFLRQVQLCQGNLDRRQGKVREMSGNLFCPVCMNPELKKRTTKHKTFTESHNGRNNQQRINNNRTTALERKPA